MENPPNQTLYINNLNEKVKKEGEVLPQPFHNSNCLFLPSSTPSLPSLFISLHLTCLPPPSQS